MGRYLRVTLLAGKFIVVANGVADKKKEKTLPPWYNRTVVFAYISNLILSDKNYVSEE